MMTVKMYNKIIKSVEIRDINQINIGDFITFEDRVGVITKIVSDDGANIAWCGEIIHTNKKGKYVKFNDNLNKLEVDGNYDDDGDDASWCVVDGVVMMYKINVNVDTRTELSKLINDIYVKEISKRHNK